MANGDDYTVGVAQSGTPDRYIANEQLVDSAGVTTAMQKTATPRSDMFLSALMRVMHRIGLTIDTSARQRVSLENIATGLTLGTVTAVGTVTTVTTVTTCASLTNVAQIGGYSAGFYAVAQSNAAAAALRGRITVS